MLNLLNNKVFMSVANTANGDVNSATRFYYNQKNGVVTATYSGGFVVKGSIIGKMLDEYSFEICYQHLTVAGELKAGYCKSKISLLDNDVIKIDETWKFLTGDQAEGTSELVEVVLN
ncbi:hypothetical protein RFI36_09995 [Acinetobacter gerneri]|uniref:N-acetylglutamate synthase n=1 Tax=Acinetobacter gerneri TaxID=202952 RepID=A0AAW8JGC3_9GAMM|nr:hypothetical protein [Acinetobacter gerneri]MDQ9009965.1 hypothetical protein [Acinetobacter gerneri]MDQ9014115.1 hypothetical protein [Acinetobacter gerneri]MDQ9025243.1 hypothetical protein [Acinetobacter gerneri]MDQ9050786.1 hypothetical protein [Acinetobacter gerneri]MDQ9060247.1 hypothetical protein [Acinetobacter gerneri]